MSRATYAGRSTRSQLARALRYAPWRLWYGARSLLCSPWYRLYFALCGVRLGPGWRMYGRPTVHRCRGSRIEAGKKLEIRSWARANPVGISHPCVLTTLEPDSFIRIGDDVGISGGCIAAAVAITIGDRVLIGADARILDNDIHPLAARGRRYAAEGIAAAPVSIGDDAFIAAAAIVLKGVTIGEGAIVGAGSVVTGDVPPYTIVAGNPARVVGQVPHG